MQVGLYMSAAGMQVQELRQAVTANNLANVQTNGFKRDMAVVQSRLNALREGTSMAGYRFSTPGALQNQGGGTGLMPALVDLTQGSMLQTGNQTDLALEGKGFFKVRGKDGQTVLTRDGRFLMDREGNLVTATDGKQVLDADGSPIQLNPSLPVRVSATGEVSQGGEGGRGIPLAIVSVKDPRSLVKLGGNALTVLNEEALTAAPADTLVRQGTLESSSADPVVEMVNMMENQRAFEANARMISYQDQTMQQLNQIGRVA